MKILCEEKAFYLYFFSTLICFIKTRDVCKTCMPPLMASNSKYNVIINCLVQSVKTNKG